MTTESEVQWSLSKSGSLEQIHNELEKASNNSSTTFCTASDSERYHGNLPKDSQPENLFPESALLRPNGSVGAEITAPKVQGSSHHLHSSSEHSNASTGLSQPSSDSDTHDAEPLQNAGRGHGSQAKHTFPKPGCKFIGRGAAPRNLQCPDGPSSQTIQDSNSPLLNKSANPYLPPHLRNLHSRTEVKDLTADSPGLMRNHKPIEGKQYNVSDQYKQNRGLKTHREGSRNHDGILGRGSSRPDNARTCSSEHASTSVGKSPATNSARYLEKGFQTKSFSHSPVPEDDNVKTDRKSMFPSEYVDQISEGEKRLAGGISKENENSELHTKPTEYVDENESKKISCQRNEVSEKLEENEGESTTEQQLSSSPELIHGESTTERQLSSSPELPELNSSSDEICSPDENELTECIDLVGQRDSVPMADRNSSDNRGLRGSYSYPRSRKNTRISPFRLSQVRSSALKIHSYDRIRLSVLHPAAYQMMIPSGIPHQSNGLPIGAHSNLLVYYSTWLNQHLHQIDGMPNPGPDSVLAKLLRGADS